MSTRVSNDPSISRDREDVRTRVSLTFWFGTRKPLTGKRVYQACESSPPDLGLNCDADVGRCIVASARRDQCRNANLEIATWRFRPSDSAVWELALATARP